MNEPGRLLGGLVAEEATAGVERVGTAVEDLRESDVGRGLVF